MISKNRKKVHLNQINQINNNLFKQLIINYNIIKREIRSYLNIKEKLKIEIIKFIAFLKYYYKFLNQLIQKPEVLTYTKQEYLKTLKIEDEAKK